MRRLLLTLPILRDLGAKRNLREALETRRTRRGRKGRILRSRERQTCKSTKRGVKL